PHIFVQELTEGAKPVDILANSKLVASPGFGGVFEDTGGSALQSVWTPDGKSIVFAAFSNRNEMMSVEVEAALFSLPATGGEPQQLTPKGASYTRPKSPHSGDALFATQTRRAVPGGRLYSLTRLARISWPPSTQAAQPTILTDAWDRSVGSFSLS